MRRLYLATILLAGAASAQDSPITIRGGSPLTISLAPTEQDWAPAGASQVNHPLPGHTVTRVEVNYADGTSVQPAFSSQQFELTLTYGSLSVRAITNPKGQALRVTTSGSFNQQYTHPNGRTWVSRDQNSSITALAIKRAGQAVPGITVKPGHIEVVIHYE